MKRLISFLLLLALGACAQLPEVDSETDLQEKSFRWLEHQVAASTVRSWKIKGRLAIKNARESGTLTLHWNQQTSVYELLLIAPFGQGSYLLKGSPDGVTMEGPKDLLLVATSPGQLLQQELGWKIHLEGLKYWIRGLPEPGVTYSELALDENGRLSNMQQSGFDIRVSRYTEQAGVSLPEKISIKGDNIQLKMVIQNWEI